jgi:hypothetical protein
MSKVNRSAAKRSLPPLKWPETKPWIEVGPPRPPPPASP